MALYPVASEQPISRPPLATLSIIGVNFLMFLLEISLGDTFIETWAFTPHSSPRSSMGVAASRPC